MDADPKVVNLAEALQRSAWKPLKRLPRYEIATRCATQARASKDKRLFVSKAMRTRCWWARILQGWNVGRANALGPIGCVMAHDISSVQKGSRSCSMKSVTLYYISNRVDYTGEQIVSLANGRCNQENVIEQLRNGVGAMRMPVDENLLEQLGR